MEHQVSPATLRVAPYTDPMANCEIRESTINALRSVQDANVDVITHRLHMLNEEWDIDRMLETSASAFVVAGTMLGFARSRKWFLLAGTAGGFLLLHAIKGWCPPASLFRRLGVRTGEEIAIERTVLKIMRNDFEHIPQDVHDMMKLAEQ